MDPGSERPRRAWPSTLAALALYGAIAAVLLAGALRGWEKLGGKDWNAFLGQAQAEATTLIDHGQFPAWNPWRRGGQVSFAQPESMLLSPVTPLALLFGANAAFKLLLLPLFVAAAMGMRALAGDLGLGGAARLLAGAIYISASVLPLYVNGGLPNWLHGMAILPWLVLASRRAATSRRWLAGGAALYAGLLLCGNVHHFVFFPLLLAVEAAARTLQQRSARPLLATAALGIAGVAFSLVRLVPLLELFSEFPRRLDASGRFMPLALVARSLLQPHAPGIDGELRVVVTEGSVLYWVDCGAYVGPVVALLAAAGVVLAWRRAWPFALIGALFLWLALGSGVEPSLWDALRRLPVYASMQAPERFMGLLVFALALLAACAGERIDGWLARRGARARLAGGWIVLVAAIAPLLAVNPSIADGAFPVEPPRDVPPSTLLARGPPPPPFTQRRFPAIPQQWGGPLYEAVLRNAGNVDGQSDVPSRRAALAAGDLGYRGELHLAAGHGELSGEITPNSIRVRAELTAPDQLVVNQTFHPGWRRAGGGEPCVARDGLLALPLAAGAHELELEYAPRSIPAGALLSLLALAALALWARARRRAAADSREAARIDVLALLSHALLIGGVVAWYAAREPSEAGAPPRPWQELATTVDPASGPDALQRAIDAAAPGAVIRVPPGDCGAATVRRGVTLVGDPQRAATVRRLAVEDLPAGETVTVVGLRFAAADAGAVRGELRIERCAGMVVIATSGLESRAFLERAEDGRPAVAEFSVRSSQRVFLAGHHETWRATLHSSRVAFSHAVFHESERDSPAVVADGSVVLFNRCGFMGSHDLAIDQVGVRLSAGSHAIISGSDPPGFGADATSSVRDLGRRPFELWFDPAPGTPGGVELVVRGPFRARGTLIVGRRPAFLPLPDGDPPQWLGVAFDGRQTLYPIELDPTGELRVPVPRFSSAFAPGDGLYVQAFLESGSDPAVRLYSLMDGGPVVPPRERDR